MPPSTTLVLLHGFPLSRDMWRPQITRRLAERLPRPALLTCRAASAAAAAMPTDDRSMAWPTLSRSSSTH